jgi:hypothetical protein
MGEHAKINFQTKYSKSKSHTRHPNKVCQYQQSTLACCGATSWALEDQEDEQRETAAEQAAASDKGQQEQQGRAWLPRHVLYNPAIR